MSKTKDFQLVFSINEDVAASSFIYLHGDNIEDYSKQDKVTNIVFESKILNDKELSQYKYCNAPHCV